jgi:hypothetical protein
VSRKSHSSPNTHHSAESFPLSTAELVTALRDLLGAKLVAYLGKVKETRAVRQWADGEREIANPADLERLRLAYRAAWLINQRNSKQVVQAWFQGLNPFLDDGTPARLCATAISKPTAPK